MAFQRSAARRIRVHVLPTDRFKTYAISVYIGRLLAEDTATSTALIPFVLRRGTAALPETKQFREALDDLYGAGFSFDVYKRGNYQMVHFRMDIVADQFVQQASGLLQKGMDFIGGAIANPLLEDGAFRTSYVEAEKETLQKRIEAIVNDKTRYAAERCVEEMYRHEPYRLHPLGAVGDLAALNAGNLHAAYESWLAAAPIDIYVVGNTTLEEVLALVEQAFPLRREQTAEYRPESDNRPVNEVHRVTERMDIQQGKLSMGARTYVSYSDELYPAALMYNGILGAYPHSKLFVHVRERASLAYYASSRLDGHKGMLAIQAGIEAANYDKAVQIIAKQLEAMRVGLVSDLELSQTRAMIVNQLRVSEDSAFEMIAFDFNNILSGQERTLSGLAAQIEQIGLEPIVEVAQQVKLDTIYFLCGKEGQ